ncbi:MAG: hypothetical protein IPL39_03730 [Opitutaceae bacterium]|nr:hypothetical protein [Opitutaceae bacterium]
MYHSLKSLIWLYVALLVFEGALRKWVLPDHADVLLVVRDPVVILIYLLALGQGRFPVNGWVVTISLLSVAALFASFLAGQTNLLITGYGLRTNFLHLPLIWVMASVLTRRDAENIGFALLLMAIPMTLLMAAQFRAPMNDILNRGVGGEEGGQIYGALGHIRPPGFFAFITGPQLFFPLAAAFFCHQLGKARRLWLPLVLACGVAILLALPLSISRTVALATLLVGTVYLGTLVQSGFLRAGLLRIAVLVAVVGLAASFLPIFDEAHAAFFSRWEEAKGPNDEGSGMASIFARFFGGSDYVLDVASSAPLFGAGIGMGSNMAARLTTGRVGFLLAESEWGRCVLELGPPLALGFLGFRIVLAFALLLHALRRQLHARDPLPLLILSSCAPALIVGQWSPPTILGFSVLGAGLCLTACQDAPPPAAEDDVESLENEDETDDDDPDETADAETGEPGSDTEPEHR